MRLATAMAVVLFALLFCVSAMADIPETISYQGVLKDDMGVPVPDGDYFITFRLYDVETGGTQLWEESQLLPTEGGVVNAHLGSVVTLTTLEFLVPYWLSIQIADGPELSPRTAFETVPYAAHAAFADHLTGGVWEVDGDDVYHEVGDVGVGGVPVDARLDVMTGDGMAADFSNGSVASPTLQAHNAGGTVGAFFSCTDPYVMPDPPAAVYGRGACGARGGHFYASSAEALYATTSGTETALVAEATGTGYAAQFLGDAGIQVQYQADVGSFRMFGGSSPGYVLTSDADGVGTWQPAAGSDGDWVISGSNMSSALTGNVGIGDPTPDGKLDVSSESAAEALIVEHEGTPARVVNIERTSLPGAGNDMLQIAVPFGSPPSFQFIECESGGSPVFYVMGDGRVISARGALFSDIVEVDGPLVGSYDSGRVAEFTTLSPTAIEVLYAEATDVGGTMDGAAVHGKYVQSIDYGIGGYFEGGWRGVAGYATSSGGALPRYGVYGHAAGTTGSTFAVYGYAIGGSYPYGGYFVGNGYVSGTLTAGAKAFKIDHPLDPANMYLYHACVESDEMKNVYDGVVVLDGRGEARVQLPEWFEALNKDYRYQLTAIGAPGPNLYVAKKIEGGSFTIGGGEPGMEVSWQVTGIRQDPYAAAHRIEVEVAKSASEVGTYMHPEAYGMPLSAGVDYTDERELPQRSEAVERTPLEPFDPTDGE